ncbi:MAG: hypothetical protein WAM98_14495 [Terriglobales bacterium]
MFFPEEPRTNATQDIQGLEGNGAFVHGPTKVDKEFLNPLPAINELETGPELASGILWQHRQKERINDEIAVLDTVDAVEYLGPQLLHQGNAGVVGEASTKNEDSLISHVSTAGTTDE